MADNKKGVNTDGGISFVKVRRGTPATIGNVNQPKTIKISLE